MFHWYQKSQICYAYLADVIEIPDDEGRSSDGKSGPQSFYVDSAAFKSSRWFTRGWTLQELLAPKDIRFFSSSWDYLGRIGRLVEEISSATGIPTQYLTQELSLASASVACKMHWLSRRKTTRREDMAYCMLGIFGINMPLLYGEGDKAFIRLQEEILKSNTDHTLFCWAWTESVPASWTSMLAPNPAVFAQASQFVQNRVSVKPLPYSMTNYGLSITLPMVQAWSYALLMLDVNDTGMSPGGEQYDYEYNRLNYKFCIPVRPRRSEDGIHERERFPPTPIPFEIRRGNLRRHVIVRARADILALSSLGSLGLTGVRGEIDINRRQSPYGFLITIQDTLHLLDGSSKSFKFWSSSAENRVLQDISKAIRFETFPNKHSFDPDSSVFWVNPEGHSRTSGLMKIGRGQDVGCVLYFEVRISAPASSHHVSSSKDVEWNCQAVPAEFWKDSESSKVKLLKRLDLRFKSGRSYQEDEGPYKVEVGEIFRVPVGGLVPAGGKICTTVHLATRPGYNNFDVEHPPEESGEADWEDELSDSSVVARVSGKRG
ncbi:hypothetical protein B0H63DRAFT_486972 [Podospora didyma]|uniref:Heterokaryon incompatibility domain-containing protein n=1 Tax=Podospora didyma TaxID=330526 RepID=A0AAE0N4G1_9PEZI|nr:hypothetical protein B0H63DRAFT_486972 [Podospora didyma]